MLKGKERRRKTSIHILYKITLILDVDAPVPVGRGAHELPVDESSYRFLGGNRLGLQRGVV
jgi:hypothetical protein